MKNFKFLSVAGLMMLCAFGIQSCSVEDNPSPNPTYPKVDVLTYDFAAAEAAAENPENRNGSAANGQAFFGWESESKTDSKRQDYKGYKWAEGSVLPAECHVWRRSDRINGNVKEGGLFCPNDREMAIDGLEAGSTVQIYYTAPEDQSIIWAVGDGRSEQLEAPRATATIDGVEAVIGESLIASGAVIDVQSVTPAENGTGYIVVKVKKNMVITKVVIATPAD